MVRPAPQIVAVERGERPVERQDLHPMPGKVELADDLRPKQADHVRRHAEPKAREDLLGDGGPSQDVSSLEDERSTTGPSEVGRGHETVVAAADHDRVVAPPSRCARHRPGA
jgi:hypothetical protein